ncbi:MAG: hypothetical protein Tsb0016_27710 [Sphingomonadales bacterium]
MTTPLANAAPLGLHAFPGKGRGIIALADLAADAVLDVAATVALDGQACALLEQTPAGQYYFAHPADPDQGLLVLGLPSLLNHSDTPNVTVAWSHDPALGWLAITKTLRPVRKGEELTRQYACPPWFAVAGEPLRLHRRRL